MIVCNIGQREPATVKLQCSRCTWKGTADRVLRIVEGADGAKMPYCPNCEGPCCEMPKESEKPS